MEIILAIVVASAVIFFGALISMGNERQRRAIDELQEQVSYWAMHDLTIKRKQLSRELHISDPLEWFNTTISKIYGVEVKLHYLEYFENPQSLIFFSDELNKRILISTLAPKEVSRYSKNKKNRLNQTPKTNPLFSLPKNTIFQRLSILNCGILFDQEVVLAWKSLIDRDIVFRDCLWMYEIL